MYSITVGARYKRVSENISFCPDVLLSFFAQMFPFGIFICIEDPVRTSDVFGGGPDMTRHGVAMSLALIALKIHRIFARRTHTTHAHTQKKGLSGFSALI